MHRPIRLASHLLLSALAVCSLPAVASASVNPATQGWNQLGKLLEARDYSAAQTLVSTQLRDQPLHPNGLLMQLTVHQYQSRGQEQPPKTLATDLKRCIEQDPTAAPCHLGLAELYGMEASSGGMLKGMRLADDIREHFKRAVELSPRNARARSGLLSFYQAAPAIVGGGAERAAALIAETRKIAPDLAQLLEVGHLIREKQTTAAMTALLEEPATADFDTRSLHQRGLISLGFALIGEQQWDDAQRVLQHASAHFPHSPFAPMGLGRIHLEQGDAQAAVPLLERALELDPQCGANYRLGLAYQELDRKTDAITQFQSFVDLQSASRNKDLLKDARARIKQLRSGG
jgi:tetratricopeptide (TPR) repeat protein